MTTKPAVLWGPVQIANAAAAIYTAPALTTVVITRAVITNESAAGATVTLWLVRSGGSRTNGNILVGAAAAGQSQAAGPVEPYVVAALAGMVLAPGDAIHAVSDTNNVLNFVGSGWTNS